MKLLYWLFLFICRFIVRASFWLVVLGLLSLLLILLFEKLLAFDTQLSTSLQSLNSSHFIKFFLGILISFPIEWFNEKVDIDLVYKWLWRPTKYFDKFSSYVLFKHIEATSNVKLFSINNLDEFVYKFYLDAKGSIHLFNPPAELVKSNEAVWENVRKAIEKNRNNINKITLAVTNQVKAEIGDEQAIADALRVVKTKIELRELTGDALTLASFFRAATYLKNNEIEYFLYRPIAKPYKDNFVFTQPAKDFGNLTYVENNHTSSLRGLINDFMK